jgi:hypothetical protein
MGTNPAGYNGASVLPAFPLAPTLPVLIATLRLAMTHKLGCLICFASLLLAPAVVRAEEGNVLARAAAAHVPVDRIAPGMRDKVTALLKDHSLYCRGKVEAFPCRPAVYEWLLDHPQWGFRAWRALGAQCATVEPKEDGWFVGVDPQGSELRWQTVLQEPGRRLWYVEGAGRLAHLTPAVSMKALVVLRYQEVVGIDGRIGIRHRAELFAQFEERTVAWLARLTGATADSSAGKAIDQVELFFSGMAWYVSEHPVWVKRVFPAIDAAPPEEKQALESFWREYATTPKS